MIELNLLIGKGFSTSTPYVEIYVIFSEFLPQRGSGHDLPHLPQMAESAGTSLLVAQLQHLPPMRMDETVDIPNDPRFKKVAFMHAIDYRGHDW